MTLVNIPNVLTFYVSERVNIDRVTNRLQLELDYWYSEYTQPHLTFRFTIS